MEKEKKEIKVTVYILMEAVLNLIQKDPHQWSDRPCETCRTITHIIGNEFGCYLYQKQNK